MMTLRVELGWNCLVGIVNPCYMASGVKNYAYSGKGYKCVCVSVCLCACSVWVKVSQYLYFGSTGYRILSFVNLTIFFLKQEKQAL